jgi:DNA-binding NtrC family response regulator
VHAVFAEYAWPGNIRELQNVIERAVILSRGRITLSDLPELIRRPVKQQSVATGSSLQELEREAIREALEQCGGNRRLAASGWNIEAHLAVLAQEYGLKDTRTGRPHAMAISAPLPFGVLQNSSVH